MAKQYRTALIIEGDAKGGIRAIQATDKELTQLNRRFEDSGNRAKRFAEDVDGTSRELEFLKNSALGVGAALAGAFAVSNIAGQAKMIQQTAALAQSLSVSTQTLQQWQYAGQQVGLEADKVGDIFKDVSDKIGDFAATGGGEAADLFENLNLNIRELQSLSPDQQILNIAEAVNQLEDPSQRTFYFESLADEMVRLQPLLADNARGLRESAAEADALGVAMNEVEISRAVEAAHAMEQLQGVATGLSNTLIADLGPGLADATGDLTTFIQQAGGAGEVLEDVATIAGTLATVYLARRLGPGLLRVGKTGLAAGGQIAQGMVIATGASGRLNQALIVTQGRIAATAAAGRALNATMGLLGGPAGIAILAAGALYTYRDELDAMLAPAQRATQRVNDLTNAINLNSEAAVEGQLVNLTAQMVQLEQQAAQAKQALEEINATSNDPGPFRNSMVMGEDADARREAYEALREAEEQLAANGQASDQLRERLKLLQKQGVETVSTVTDLGDASDEAAQAAEKQAAALEALRRELDPAYAAQQELAEQTATLDKGLQAGALTLVEYLSLWDRATESFIGADEGAEEYQKRTKELVQQYDASAQKAQQLEQAVEDINQAYRNGDINGDQYARMMGNVRDEMRQLAAESDPMAQEMARAWEEAANRIDETFADAFTGAFETFEDFGDQLLDGFKRLLGELAYQATLKPIVVQMTGQMQSAMGIPGSGASSQSSSMGGMGDLTSIGKNVYNGVVDGFGSINWMGNPTSYSGGWAGSATAGMNSGGGFLSNGSMSDFSGMQGLAALPASMAGSYVGNTVGESLTGKQANSNIGSTAGAAIGTFFGGPIGAFAGSAIGGLLDSAFGSAGPELDLAMMRGDAASYETGDWDHGLRSRSALGTVGFQGAGSHDINATWGEDNAQKALDAIAQLDNVLASLAETPEQLQQMTDAVLAPNRHGIQGHYGETSTPSVAVETLTSRYKAAIDSLDLALEDTILGIDSGAQDLVSTATSLNAFEDLVGDNAQALADARDALADSDDLVATAQALASQAQAMASLSDAAERLNLTFDATSSGALSAAGSMAALVGGVDTLASLQQRYYQTFTTGQERFADLTQDLSEQFGELGYSLPMTRDGFKRLVEAQDLMTISGRRTYAALLQLAPAMADYIEGVEQFTDTFDELLASAQASASNAQSVVEQAYAGFSNTAFEQQLTLLELAGRGTEALALQRQKELATLDEALRPTQERIWQLQDEAAAMDDYTNALSQASSFLASALDNIAAFVDESLATSGSPTENLQTTQEQFARQLVLAESGDRNALQSITQYADRYLQAAQSYYASGTQSQQIQDDVLGALQGLPELLSPEDYVADEIRQALEDSQNLGALPGIEELADAQLDELGKLVDEMTRTTDQFVGLNATMVSLQDSINALGVAQEEIARIEREQAAAEKAERQRLVQERAAAEAQAQREAEVRERRGELQTLIEDKEALIERNAPLAKTYGDRADDDRQGYWSESYLQELDREAQSRAGDWDAMQEYYELQQSRGNGHSADYFYNLVREYAYGNSVSAAQSAIEQAEKELGNLPAFASGGLHSGGWALVGEEGPELVNMGPSRIYDASTTQDMLGTSRSLPPSIVPPIGATGNSDALAALLRENNRLMRENGELLKRLDAHGAAAVKVAQAGHSQSIEVQKRSAQSLETMERKARMEALS